HPVEHDLSRPHRPVRPRPRRCAHGRAAVARGAGEMGSYRAHGRLSLVGDRATAREVQTLTHEPLRSHPLPLSFAYNPAETPTRSLSAAMQRKRGSLRL